MKLRNKKTGEIWDIGKVLVNDYPCWETLTQICEDWEDVKEPLIKDEKVRKAVRAWAEINLILDDDDVEASTPTVDCNVLTLTYGTISIDVFVNDTITIINHGHYTIDELCGEEE